MNMKKTIYYVLLVLAWILAVLILALLLVITGIISSNFGFGASLGTACGHPQLWVISIGIVLLLRPVIYKLVVKEERLFKKTVANILIVVGVIWLIINVGTRLYLESIEKDFFEQHKFELEQYKLERYELE